MAKKTYEIELTATPASGAKKTMWRGGRQFEVKVPQVLDLTKEEVEVYKNDKRFKVKNSSSKSESDKGSEASGSESDAPTTDTETAEEDVTSEDTDSEDSSSDEAEEDSDEATEAPSVDDLVRDNSREELNALAKEAGVEQADTLENKTEVAQAIVEAQANQSDESGATS